MERQPRHTLITPAHNSVWCLPDWFEGIAAQSLRPDEIMLGIDSCEDTAQRALELVEQWPQLPVSVYWFPTHVGCYVIRNTLAELAQGDYLHLFDADDIMLPDHIEHMAELAQGGEYVLAASKVVEKGKPERTMVCHGVACVKRETLMRFNGFEGWPCGADSELIFRLAANGIRVTSSRKITMTVRKHAGSLTRRPDTGMHTKMRQKYKNECARRKKHPQWVGQLQTGYCYQIKPGDSIGAAGAEFLNIDELPSTEIEMRQLDNLTDPFDVECVGGGFALWNFCAMRSYLPLGVKENKQETVGWDYAISRKLHKAKFAVKMHPGVLCKHDNQGMGGLSAPCRVGNKKD